MKIGVLAIQGDFDAHRRRLEELGAEVVEVRKPEERLARLKERLRRGDPDMEPDELHAAIERAEAKRRELLTPRAVNATARSAQA